MRLRKNLLIALLCALIAALGLFCFVGCDGCSPDDGGNQGVVTPNMVAASKGRPLFGISL